MPPSNSRLPGPDRTYRDGPYSEAEEADPQTDSVQHLLKNLELSSDTTSVDELAHILKEHFNLEAKHSSMRDLAKLVIGLKLKDAVTSPTASDRSSKENNEPVLEQEQSTPTASNETPTRTVPKSQGLGVFSRRGSNPRMASVNRLPRSSSRCASPRHQDEPAAEQPLLPRRSPLRSQSPMRSKSPFRGLFGRSVSNTNDPGAGIPPPTPHRSVRQTPTKATPVNTSDDSFVSPPSSTGTFDSLNRTFDSMGAMADTPGINVDGINVDTPEVATPMMEDTKTDDVQKTGEAKRRNKDTTPPVPNQPAFNQAVGSPPHLQINFKSKKGAKSRRAQPRKTDPVRPATQLEPPQTYVIPPYVQQPPQQPYAQQQTFVPPAPTAFMPPQQQQTFAQPAPAPYVPPPQPQTFGQPASAQQQHYQQQTFAQPAASLYGQPQPAYQNSLYGSLPNVNSTTPYNVRQQTTSPKTPFISPMDLDVKFSIGTSGKRASPGGRARRVVPNKLASPRHPVNGGPPFFGTSVPVPQSAFSPVQVVPSASQESKESVQTAASKSSSNVDYSGRNAMVESLRKDARDHYINGDYRLSVNKYTIALATHNRETNLVAGIDDRRAILLANRAAALLMVGAYEASVFDCQLATKCVSDLEDLEPSTTGKYVLTSEGGPILKAKVYTRMGRACIKLGELDDAADAFHQAVSVVLNTLEIISRLSEDNQMQLNQVHADATSGKTEITRCRESVEVIKNCGLRTPKDAATATRKVNLRGLSNINSALSLAPGCLQLLDMKLAVLASLNRWRELYACCERVASETVNFDGVFTHDMEARKPLPNVPAAKYLKAGLAENDENVKLSSKAVAEVALRLPPSFQPLYIRALRLEERCQPALNAVNVLCDFVAAYVSGADRANVAWIVREQSKLQQSISTKEKGDFLFRQADYKGAVHNYTMCLSIDSEGRPGEIEGAAGGRLSAVLHCNRAASYMALLKYREAITDCTASLRIHSHYMKAMLRRSRCYVRLSRFEEAQAEYERYISLVESARKSASKSSNFENPPCVFDGPKDVQDGDLEAVREELKEVLRAKINVENNARREEAERQSRQNWYNETFGQSQPGDAERRRQDWYSQQDQDKGSRRWDSFNGASPKPPGRSSRQGDSFKGGRGPHRSKSYREEPRKESSRQEEQKEKVVGSPGSDASVCHYTVLSINRTATDIEIKKAYKMAALKHHPDKNQQTDSSDMFRRVKLAYDVLKDPAQKRDYDTQLRWNRRY